MYFRNGFLLCKSRRTTIRVLNWYANQTRLQHSINNVIWRTNGRKRTGFAHKWRFEVRILSRHTLSSIVFRFNVHKWECAKSLIYEGGARLEFCCDQIWSNQDELKVPLDLKLTGLCYVICTDVWLGVLLFLFFVFPLSCSLFLLYFIFKLIVRVVSFLLFHTHILHFLMYFFSVIFLFSVTSLKYCARMCCAPLYLLFAPFSPFTSMFHFYFLMFIIM